MDHVLKFTLKSADILIINAQHKLTPSKISQSALIHLKKNFIDYHHLHMKVYPQSKVCLPVSVFSPDVMSIDGERSHEPGDHLTQARV